MLHPSLFLELLSFSKRQLYLLGSKLQTLLLPDKIQFRSLLSLTEILYVLQEQNTLMRLLSFPLVPLVLVLLVLKTCQQLLVVKVQKIHVLSLFRVSLLDHSLIFLQHRHMFSPFAKIELERQILLLDVEIPLSFYFMYYFILTF